MGKSLDGVSEDIEVEDNNVSIEYLRKMARNYIEYGLKHGFTQNLFDEVNTYSDKIRGEN